MATAETLRVTFVDFWDGLDPEQNFIVEALREIVHVEIDDTRPELIFRSVFGERHRRYQQPKVLVKAETDGSERRKERFVIGHEHSTSDSRLRYPLWAWDQHTELMVPSSERRPQVGERFCNFLYSNHRSSFRNGFFVALNDRKPVDALNVSN